MYHSMIMLSHARRARADSIIRCCWLDVVLLYKQISHLTAKFNQRTPQETLDNGSQAP